MSLKVYKNDEVQDYLKDSAGWLLFGLQMAEFDSLLPIWNAYSANIAITMVTAIKLRADKSEISRTTLATDIITWANGQYLTDFTKDVDLSKSIYKIEFKNGIDTFTTEPFRVYNAAGLPQLNSPALSLGYVTPTKIAMFWTDPNSAPNEVDFDIEQSDTGTGGWVSIASPSQDVGSWIVTGVTNSTTKYYRIIAKGDNVITSDSDPSNIISGTTKSGTLSLTNQFGGIVTQPYGISYEPVNDKIYIDFDNASNIKQFVPQTWFSDDSVASAVINGRGNVPDNTGDILYAASNGNYIREADLHPMVNNTTHVIAGSQFLTGIAYDSVNDFIYISGPFDDSIYVWDVGLGALDRTITDVLIDNTRCLHYYNGFLYGSNVVDANIIKIDLSDDSVVEIVSKANLGNPVQIRGFALDGVNNRLVVSTNITSDNRVYFFDLTGSSTQSNITLTGNSDKINYGAYDSLRERFLFTSEDDDLILEIS